jgi:hypothetical protein
MLLLISTNLADHAPLAGVGGKRRLCTTTTYLVITLVMAMKQTKKNSAFLWDSGSLPGAGGTPTIFTKILGTLGSLYFISNRFTRTYQDLWYFMVF